MGSSSVTTGKGHAVHATQPFNSDDYHTPVKWLKVPVTVAVVVSMPVVVVE